MKLSVQIAAQRRHVRRIEDDFEPFLFRLRTLNASPETTEKVKDWFQGILERERRTLAALEKQEKQARFEQRLKD